MVAILAAHLLFLGNTEGENTVRNRLFVLAFDVPYPGDFFMSGRWWRAIKVVEAKNAAAAVAEGFPLKPVPNDCAIVVATSYPPAFDVVRSREVSRLYS
jgi:hypothetical protein